MLLRSNSGGRGWEKSGKEEVQVRLDGTRDVFVVQRFSSGSCLGCRGNGYLLLTANSFG